MKCSADPKTALMESGKSDWLDLLKRKILMAYRPILIVAGQLLLVGIAYAGSFWVRFEFMIPADQWAIFAATLPILIAARMGTCGYYRLFSTGWRFVSLRELMDIWKAAFWGSIIFVSTLFALDQFHHFPRSIIALEALLNVTLTGGVRFLTRYFHEAKARKGSRRQIGKRVLIAGAGKTGVFLVNEVRNNPDLGIEIVGVVDDHLQGKGLKIQGVPVLGNSEEIKELIAEHSIDEVIIALPSEEHRKISQIRSATVSARKRVKVIPPLARLIQEDDLVIQPQEVSYDELLGRRIIRFTCDADTRGFEEEIKDRAVLVTGAGGSIGSELCKQIARFEPRILIPYERYENSLYEIELELRRDFPSLPILPMIGDILDEVKVRRTLKANRVDLIFHAAAYKHVPMMEREPIEAVRNNILGTRTLARCAIEAKTKRFLLISTDKAVYPTSIMGMTKRVAEMVIQSHNGFGTRFFAVRFGNVIGSNGSVIPLFKKQIAHGGPVTVTHPEATRYLMAISEAVQLVLTAGAMGRGGEIFLLDMGEPIRILDLAMKLIKRAGLELGKDIQIVYTGLRPGEKMHEELYWRGEGISATENQKITALRPRDTKYEDLAFRLAHLEKYVSAENSEEVHRLLKELVPEGDLRDGETPGMVQNEIPLFLPAKGMRVNV